MPWAKPPPHPPPTPTPHPPHRLQIAGGARAYHPLLGQPSKNLEALRVPPPEDWHA